MSERFYGEKLKRAVHLLLFRRGKMPGAREWELKQQLGRNYQQVVEQLNALLAELDLEVKKVKEDAIEPASGEAPEARYLVTLKGSITPREARMSGWRIDNLAALAASMSFVVSKQGKAPREEVEKLLIHKVGRWKTLTLLDSFVRNGYLSEDIDGTLALGWRAKAEVNLTSLMTLLAESRT